MSTSQESRALAPQESILVFFSYSHKDKLLRNRLDEHLSNLKYRRLITTWYDQEIKGGEEWAQHIHANLDKAKIILLLVSPSFMSSGYCYGIEMKRALERHDKREAEVIPILLRAVHYAGAPFEKLHMLPNNAKPVTLWRDRDSAFLEIAYGIEKIAQDYCAEEGFNKSAPFQSDPSISQPPPPVNTGGLFFPESSPQYMGTPQSRPPSPRASRTLSPLVLVLLVAPVLIIGAVYLWQRSNFLSFMLRILTYGLVILIGVCLLVAIVAIVPRIVQFVRNFLRSRTNKQAERLKTPRGAGQSTFGRRPEAVGTNKSHESLRFADAQQGIPLRRMSDLRKERYYEDAIIAYNSALRRNPSDGYAYQGLGNAYYALENYRVALMYFQNAIHWTPTASAYTGLANTYTKLQRYQEAVETFEKAVELDGEMNFNSDGYVEALGALGRTQQARHVLTQIQAQYGYE